MVQTASESDGPRRVPGRPWPKGVSGNPKGRAGEVKVNGKTIAELARSMTHDELHAVVEVRQEAHRIMMSPDTPLPQRLQAGALCIQASEAVLRRGWGDAPRTAEAADSHVVFVVRTCAEPAVPTPGVLRSPIAGHVALASIPRADVIDAEPVGNGRPMAREPGQEAATE
jgi:hypothetical protein